MDLFDFSVAYGVLICKPCGYAVLPYAITCHLVNKHIEDINIFCTVSEKNANQKPSKVARMFADSLLSQYNILDPRYTKIPMPSPDAGPVPGLKIHNGVKCSKCDQVNKHLGSMKTHYNIHLPVRRRAGRPIPRVAGVSPEFYPVHCQRFFLTGKQSNFFAITLPEDLPEEVQRKKEPAELLEELVQEELQRKKEPAKVLAELVQEELQYGNREQQLSMQVYQNQATKTEVSPWLEMTRWPRYFHGLKLDDVAPLAYSANPDTEQSLLLLTESVDRLIEQAYQSITQDKISVFDQAKINSFISDKSARGERMLMVKLSKETFRAYKGLWKRLLCFTYRTSLPHQPIQLLHRFTTAQLVQLNRAMLLAEELRSIQKPQQQCDESEMTTTTREEKEIVRDLDRAVLLLCISLLDHTLEGDHFESVVLSFLAVLGIDERPGEVFKGPLSYSPQLSKFIKISQMLVVQRAVMAVEDGHAEYPSTMIGEMRERFMVRGSRSAFDWAYRLRSYAKKMLSNTTSVGYIIWSEDAQTITYKDASFTMDALKHFVTIQVREAQQELENLLLLHPDENRDTVPKLFLHRLQDNHANTQQGWNFLKDPRNAEVLEAGGEKWILNRVLHNDWLRKEMVSLTHDQKMQWKKPAATAYFKKIDKFLERLLLLMHITSGQPARGTELLSLQHSNTPQGHHRSIFMEEGLISTVTSYHKGYNITGSAKVIHRYLPLEVSELLVYYLWLVLPFRQQLDILVNKRKAPPSAFLWPKADGAWLPERLTTVLKRETTEHLKVPLVIMMYRHMAIAISRQHLRCGGFKRDYGIDKKMADEQATHGSWYAGTIYARGLQEAPGHVAARKSEYRTVSREWHNFLGFRVFLGSRKRPLAEVIL